jgi:hypothetical protein
MPSKVETIINELGTFSAPQTVAFSNSGGYWKTRYRATPLCYATVGNKMTSSPRNIQEGAIIWEHNKGPIGSNYGVVSSFGSMLAGSFNDNVSANKLYKSVSIEGTGNVLRIFSGVYVNSSPDISQLRAASFKPMKHKGGILYASITGSSSINSSSSNYQLIGRVKEGVDLIDMGSGQTGGYSGLNNFVFLALEPTGSSIAAHLSNDAKFVFGFTQADGTIDLVTLESFGPFDQPDIDPFFVFTSVSMSTPYDDIVETIEVPDSTIHFYSQVIGEEGVFIRLTNLFDPNAPDVALNAAFYERLNNHISSYPDRPVYLYQVSNGEVNGESPKGQYADYVIFLGNEDFELHAVNANYVPIRLDHSR